MIRKICSKCDRELKPVQGIVSYYKCPKCGNVYHDKALNQPEEVKDDQDL